MSPSRMFPRILQCSLLFCSLAGCLHRSVVPETTAAPDGTAVGVLATTYTSAGIQSARLEDVKTSRIEDLFAGRFAGVQVHRTGAGKLSVRIRGVEPLVVVDGLEGDSHLLTALRSQEVVRIDVLKEPDETAIYGNRGVNGVIVITTRWSRLR